MAYAVPAHRNRSRGRIKARTITAEGLSFLRPTMSQFQGPNGSEIVGGSGVIIVRPAGAGGGAESGVMTSARCFVGMVSACGDSTPAVV